MNLFLFALLSILRLAWAGSPQEDANAGIDDHAKAAYFVLNGYVFSLNVVENGDVYFHMNAPSSHSWMGIGFGGDMSNARMIVSYLGANGHNITNSCRISKGQSEPEVDPDCVIEDVWDDHYAPFGTTLTPDGVMISHAVCRNCSTWAGGFIDTKSHNQPFIYALGPNVTLRSDDRYADLRLHSYYGTFNLDMTVATNYSGYYGRVPAPNDPGLQTGHAFWAFANYFSSPVYGFGTLEEWSPAAHASFMCVAFLLVFPLGAISLRLVRRAAFHAMIQMVGLVLTWVGFGMGVYAATLYNKSKHFNSVHQIIGLFIFAGLFLQIGLGLSHHLLFLRSGKPTALGIVHRYLGIGMLVLAVINGGLGFQFSGNSFIAYVAVVAVMAVILAALSLWVWVYNRTHSIRSDKATKGPAAEPYRDATDQASDEYEMQQRPRGFRLKKAAVQTPRTPVFADRKWDDDPENYRAHLQRSTKNQASGTTLHSRYTDDTPASELQEMSFQPKADAGPLSRT